MEEKNIYPEQSENQNENQALNQDQNESQVLNRDQNDDSREIQVQFGESIGQQETVESVKENTAQADVHQSADSSGREDQGTGNHFNDSCQDNQYQNSVPVNGTYPDNPYRNDAPANGTYPDNRYRNDARINESYADNRYQNGAYTGGTYQNPAYQNNAYADGSFRKSAGQGNAYQTNGYGTYQENGYTGASYQNNAYQNGGYRSDFGSAYQNYGGYQQYNGMQSYPDNQLELEEPVKVSEWVLSLVLMMIPCVNIIMMFVWAFSKTEKKSKSNFFKAYLIFYGIAVGVMLLIWVAVVIFALLL